MTDGAGNVFPMQPGEFRFPLAALGNYRLAVEPPGTYTAPSVASRQQLAALTRPGGGAFLIDAASFGDPFALATIEPVRIDIPLDPPTITASLTKTASRARVVPGDVVFYTLTLTNPDPRREKAGVTIVDTPSPWLRLRKDTVRIDGEEATDGQVTISPTGDRLTFDVGPLQPSGSRTIVYAMTVRADAPAGNAVNDAIATDERGGETQARAVVRIDRETIGSRMTVIGRVSAGRCSVTGDGEGGRVGIPGVRIMLEDGSFAITDEDGRYHFEGLVPGTHVVQANRQTLPEGSNYVDCTRSTRSAGSANSRFVIGQGGSLIVADFHATVTDDVMSILQELASRDDANIDGSVGDASDLILDDGEEFGNGDRANLSPFAQADAVNGTISGPSRTLGPLGSQRATTADDSADARAASGASTDWLALGDGPTDFLFPDIGHNPRTPAIRVVIRHRADETVRLMADGKAVDPLSFDGSKVSGDNAYAVSIWRGVPLNRSVTKLSAAIVAADGSIVRELTRDVQFTTTPARARVAARANPPDRRWREQSGGRRTHHRSPRSAHSRRRVGIGFHQRPLRKRASPQRAAAAPTCRTGRCIADLVGSG